MHFLKGDFQSENHRVVEYFELEGTYKEQQAQRLRKQKGKSAEIHLKPIFYWHLMSTLIIKIN